VPDLTLPVGLVGAEPVGVGHDELDAENTNWQLVDEQRRVADRGGPN
jgi:hypothetical protein